MFINDIAEICCGTVKHALFADDLKLSSEITLVSAGTDVQESLSKLESWCSTWQLSVNIEKSHVQHIGFNNVWNIILFILFITRFISHVKSFTK